MSRRSMLRIKWQDWAMAIAGWIFAPSLIVSIVDKAQYPLGTTVPTVIGLLIILVAQYTLGLKLSALTTSITTICWVILIFI